MNKYINIPNEKINESIKLYLTPLQLYDECGIINNLNKVMNEFNKKFKFSHFFAVKALPNPHILRILIDNGSGLDCSSLSELKIAKSLNIDANKIIFTSNYTSIDDLRYAIDMGVIINLDDYSLISTLYSINKCFPKKIFFRLNPGIGFTSSESKSNVLGGPDAKFGISPDNIVKCYQLSKDLGCEEFGIHMMTGSCVMNNNYWIESINILINNIKKIEKEVKIKIKFINIGGGIGIPYKPEEKEIDIQLLVNTIYNTFKENDFTIPELYMENGRYITGPHGYLVSKCNCVKESFNQIYYGLDACMSNLMRPGMYNSYHHISILNRNNDKNKKICNVVGTLCENNDWFAKNRLLTTCDINDIFIIHDTGAHSHSMGFQYNGKLRAPEVLFTKNNELKLIRRRENFEDYIATVNMPRDVV